MQVEGIFLYHLQSPSTLIHTICHLIMMNNEIVIVGENMMVGPK